MNEQKPIKSEPVKLQPAKPQPAKQRMRRVVESGKIYITATFNNTLVTVTTEAAIKKATEEFGLRKADIFVKGIGPGREASLRAVRASQIDVSKIVDVTPIPHNGVRPPKIRRV